MLLALLAAALPQAIAPAAERADIVRESVYNYVIINDDGRVVSFRRQENGAVISAIDKSHPTDQVIPYTGYLFAPALVKPNPQSVLNLGLGAGAFNRLFNAAFPDSVLTTVEIDPMIVEAAKQYTSFQVTDKNRVEIADGRRYVRLSQQRWDWIIIDVYIRNSQIPPHMTTVEFYRQVRDHLSPDGVMAVNLVASGELRRRIETTIAAVFPHAAMINVPGRSNIVGVASMNQDVLAALGGKALPPQAALLERNSAPISTFHTQANPPPKVVEDQILTDDFAPTEFLELH